MIATRSCDPPLVPREADQLHHDDRHNEYLENLHEYMERRVATGDSVQDLDCWLERRKQRGAALKTVWMKRFYKN